MPHFLMAAWPPDSATTHETPHSVPPVYS